MNQYLKKIIEEMILLRLKVNQAFFSNSFLNFASLIVNWLRNIVSKTDGIPIVWIACIKICWIKIEDWP